MAGSLQIDGTVNGDVRAHAVVVDSQGVVHGEVIAEEVLVRGRIIGPIRGIHVHVYAGGHVQGDVINETISVDNGAYIDGTIRRSDDPLAEPGSPQQYEQQYEGQIDPPSLAFWTTRATARFIFSKPQPRAAKASSTE